MSDSDRAFIYWDHSNIFIGGQAVAEEREGLDARFRMRVRFENMLRLAHADRPVEKATAAGSVPPELRRLWNRMEEKGMEVTVYDRGDQDRGEQEVPDNKLQLKMLRDVVQHNGRPGVAVLLSGDGRGFHAGEGFFHTLELMHGKGWRVELLAWNDSCHRQMRKWVEQNGVFIPLDDFYEEVTYLEPSRPGFPLAESRPAKELDLSRRPVSQSRGAA